MRRFRDLHLGKDHCGTRGGKAVHRGRGRDDAAFKSVIEGNVLAKIVDDPRADAENEIGFVRELFFDRRDPRFVGDEQIVSGLKNESRFDAAFQQGNDAVAREGEGVAVCNEQNVLVGGKQGGKLFHCTDTDQQCGNVTAVRATAGTDDVVIDKIAQCYHSADPP